MDPGLVSQPVCPTVAVVASMGASVWPIMCVPVLLVMSEITASMVCYLIPYVFTLVTHHLYKVKTFFTQWFSQGSIMQRVVKLLQDTMSLNKLSARHLISFHLLIFHTKRCLIFTYVHLSPLPDTSLSSLSWFLFLMCNTLIIIPPYLFSYFTILS